ncbi:MAG: AAA family ATPase [Saprospiraceae bacterium]|nr:AAA family ATPase [Saprospiraceae bacterium]
MTYENFTVSAQDAILKGQRLAASLNQEEVQTAHLLIGIMDADEPIVPELFKVLNINMPLLKRELYNYVEKQPRVKNVEKQKLSPEANAMLSKSKRMLADFGDQYITPELMVLGLVDGNDAPAVLLKGLGCDVENVKKAITEVRHGKKVTDQANAVPLQNLNKFAINLNAKALNGSLDKIIGRDEEIRRIIHILSRRNKNNPILVGDPGVGKSAIVEGIAWRIVNKDVPEILLTKQLYALDLPAIIAGAKYKGEFEERLKFILDDVKSSNGEIILFIEDIHTLVGAGGGNGAMDAAGIIKPALSRGELYCIGTTTPEEYQKYFESDKTLASKFQNVEVDEPTVEETLSILRGAQEKFEQFHKIGIKDDALKAAAELSARYVTDRKLPDKALDLIDEAASKLRLELDSMPDDIDEVKRKVQQLEIEKELLRKEGDNRKVVDIEARITQGKADFAEMTKRWENERSLANEIQQCKKQIDEFNTKLEVLLNQGDNEQYAALQAGAYAEVKQKLIDAEQKLASIPEEELFTSGEVGADDVAEVISRWTGVPVNKMMKNDKDRLLSLEAEIGKRLIGQKEAVAAVSDAVRRSRAGLQDPNKPIGSFIFLGPTGVGKTELAKALAEVLFDDENAITRIDMSEYQEKHAVSRLVGAPPGYVGYDEGGQLTEAVRRRPYTIILLDEIEKAHPDTFNILLQLLDDGRLTDNKGRVANFRNTIVIMTSNMGSDLILENFEDLEALGEAHKADIIETTKEEVLDVLKDNLRPEFLNRIDEKIVFTPLSREEVKKIAALMLKKVIKNIGLQGIILQFTDSAMNLIVDMGYDPAFGARPLKRVIDKELVNHLARAVLSASFKEGDSIFVGTDKMGFTFSGTAPTTEEMPPKVQAKTPPKSDKVKDVEKAAKDLQQAVEEVKKDKQKT